MNEPDKPVAWRVKDFADGWILFNDKARALREAADTGATLEPLYTRPAYVQAVITGGDATATMTIEGFNDNPLTEEPDKARQGLFAWLRAAWRGFVKEHTRTSTRWEHSTMCPKTLQRISWNEYMDSYGLCPRCGHKERGTITHGSDYVREVTDYSMFGIVYTSVPGKFKPAWKEDDDE